MITIKDINEAWEEGTNSDIDKLARQLLKERDAWMKAAKAALLAIKSQSYTGQLIAEREIETLIREAKPQDKGMTVV